MELVATSTMTVEEYIAFEETSETRHEFIDGQLYEMPETTDSHNDMCFNITAILKQLIRPTKLRAYMESVKVRILNDKDYTYPDIFVTDERDLGSPLIKRYPSVIIEVLC